MIDFEVGTYYIHGIDSIEKRYCVLYVCLEKLDEGAIVYDLATFMGNINKIDKKVIELLKPTLDYMNTNIMNEEYLHYVSKYATDVRTSPIQFNYSTQAWYNKYKLLKGESYIDKIKKIGYF